MSRLPVKLTEHGTKVTFATTCLHNGIIVYYIGSLCSYGVHALLLSIGSMVRALVMHIVLFLSSAFVVLIIVHLGLILSGVHAIAGFMGFITIVMPSICGL